MHFFRNRKIGGVQYWKINGRVHVKPFRMCARCCFCMWNIASCHRSLVHITQHFLWSYRRDRRSYNIDRVRLRIHVIVFYMFGNGRRSSIQRTVTLKREPIIMWQSLWSFYKYASNPYSTHRECESNATTEHARNNNNNNNKSEDRTLLFSRSKYCPRKFMILFERKKIRFSSFRHYNGQ